MNTQRSQSVKRLFKTLYNIQIVLEGPNAFCYIYRWNPYKQKSELVDRKKFELSQLHNFGKFKQAAINTSGTWVKDEDIDRICSKFHWPKFLHYTGCKTCNNMRFIPLISHYTGCPTCNKNDKGKYTYFEANQKGQEIA